MGLLDNILGKKNEETPPVTRAEAQSYKVSDRIAGRYEIHTIYGGEGKTGMGIVYICYDHEYKEFLALKTFQDRFQHSKKIKDSFKKEALAWIHLEKHPHIVRAHWVQELDNRMFIACEFVTPDAAGKSTLTHHIKNPSLRQALIWSIQFCYGMEYAYSKGVTPHRDIKPDNIMITMDGKVKITDFGLAGLWDKAEAAEELKSLMGKNHSGFSFLRIAKNRIVAGTPSWMAPEQFNGIADVRSDIYSFGIVLFQLAAKGELPFRPKEGNDWETAHKTYPVPSISGQGKPMTNIIERCLDKRREKRYRDFAELREDIESVFKREITKKSGEKPPPPPAQTEMREWEHINKGLSLANLGLIDEAIREYREGLRINPRNVFGHNNLGNAYAQKNLFDEAVKEYKEAISLDPAYTTARYNLGIAFSQKGMLDDAIRAYREALRTNPEFADAYINLGDTFLKKGLTEAAIKEYREALRIKPECVEAYVNIGNAIAKKGMLDEAIMEYRKALKIRPEYAEAHQNLGTALFRKDLIDDAIREYKEAINIRPEYAEARQNLGTAFFKKGAVDEAVREYREAIRIKPEYAEALHNLGFALVKKGLFSEAVNAYEDFIKCARQQDTRIEKARDIVRKLKEKLKSG